MGGENAQARQSPASGREGQGSTVSQGVQAGKQRVVDRRAGSAASGVVGGPGAPARTTRLPCSAADGGAAAGAGSRPPSPAPPPPPAASAQPSPQRMPREALPGCGRGSGRRGGKGSRRTGCGHPGREGWEQKAPTRKRLHWKRQKSKGFRRAGAGGPDEEERIALLVDPPLRSDTLPPAVGGGSHVVWLVSRFQK